MPYVSRYRVKKRDIYPVGTHETSSSNWGGPFGPPSVSNGWLWITGEDECNDFVKVDGPPYSVPHDLAIKHDGGRPGVLNGSTETSLSWWRRTRHVYDNYSTYRFCSRVHPGILLPVLPAPSLDWGVTRLLSQLPDNIPPVDTALMLFELRELPSLLMSTMRGAAGLPRQIKRLRGGGSVDPTIAGLAKRYIETTFGWEPMVNDAESLFDAADAINAHLRKLRRSRGNDSFRVTLYSDTRSTTSPVACYTDFVNVSCVSSVEQWATARYRVIDPDELDRLIHKYATAPKDINSLFQDTTVTASTVYNSIPWTWLIDYLLNVGDFVEAVQGSVPVTLDDVCIMTHQSRVESSEGKTFDDGIAFSGHRFVFGSKARKVVTALNPRIAFRPALPGHALSVLGALATMSAVRR